MSEDKNLWNPGLPPNYVSEEWFFAKLKDGSSAVLKGLPSSFSYDFKTVDETYYSKDWIVGWLQTPDTQYLTPNEQMQKRISELEKKLAWFESGVHTCNPDCPRETCIQRMRIEELESQLESMNKNCISLNLHESRMKGLEAKNE